MESPIESPIESQNRKSNFVGVSWNLRAKKWATQVNFDGKVQHLGYFADEEDAARKYDEHVGPLGKPVNFPTEPHHVPAVKVSGRKRGRKPKSEKKSDPAAAGATAEGATAELAAANKPVEPAPAVDASPAAPAVQVAVQVAVADFGHELDHEVAAEPAPKKAKKPWFKGDPNESHPSKYVGVSWSRRARKWAAQVTIEGKIQHLGYSENDADAARLFDAKMRELNRPVNFPEAPGEVKANKRGSSQYKGLSYCKDQKKWRAEVRHHGAQIFLGMFEDEEEGGRRYAEAKKVIREGGVPVAAPRPNFSSRFKGVSWHVKSRKWKAAITVNGKHQSLGYFASEEDAARKFDEHARGVQGRKINFPEGAAGVPVAAVHEQAAVSAPLEEVPAHEQAPTAAGAGVLPISAIPVAAAPAGVAVGHAPLDSTVEAGRRAEQAREELLRLEAARESVAVAAAQVPPSAPFVAPPVGPEEAEV
mmetsp:Transcript_35973/g.80906  ORF Transcript_35973/g.80906 Transcript_35973/m.80906 type:complete len:476 (-) Transcript_35973:210-1637(-)